MGRKDSGNETVVITVVSFLVETESYWGVLDGQFRLS